MHPAITQLRADVSAICQRYPMRPPEVFDSVARADDLDADGSEADFLAEFLPEVPANLQRFLGIKSASETLLGWGVDLIDPGAVRKTFALASIHPSHGPAPCHG